MPQFSHLHCHTQFSLLDGASNITDMMKKAQADGMPAVALTDHGNMFGAFKFVAEANKYNVKPIVGCEFYVVKDRHKRQFSKEDKDIRYHQLLLAKDAEGYKNLSKLCSLGYMEGLYSKWPRIDKELVLKYHKGLIATTCCIGAEVPQVILNHGADAAEENFKWWLDLFGDDYYIELQRHKLKEQEIVNEALLKYAKKFNVKIIASNDSHYIDQEDYNSHDILLCVNTGELQNTPVGDGRGFRFGFPNDQFYFKSQAEMAALFKDLPQSLENTQEIVDKINTPKLQRDILLPNFPLPPEFANLDAYLHHLTFAGAKERYKEIESHIEERLNHELHIIKTMGFAGYFLIVSDFIKAGRDLGVLVGPGRGSAAGSVVAYCVGITNIDPIKYNLLFERFLNPERVSMPDIDTDFDDEGRQKVIDYVVDKYGYNQVAQIITYGTMAAKSAIKDVSRVMDLPLAEANALAKLVPERPGITLKGAYGESPELALIRKGSDAKATVLKLAEKLEGSVRNSGIHASAVIIAPDDLTEYIPVSTSKESNLLVTQFDGKVIESAGMLKMDFLGLKTLTIIKYALQMIKRNQGITIDIDNIPLEDAKTFELYQNGDTVGTFQFESDGMRQWLVKLKPTDIEDLIAMNALYRPGPMQFIPNFIDRKHGREVVEYPHPLLEGILKNSYGIMVYQEQIMQTAQIIAGYSLGGADLLRRAMGKKDKEKMAKERVKFVEGAGKLHSIPKEKAEQIFDIMEKFAEYGFNRSHSAAYSVVAYQTGYLKAHFPAEYLAAVLTLNMGKIEKITFFMDECKRQNIKVLGPDLNESNMFFDVNKRGQIRFGLGAIKGAGEAAIDAIISERDKSGPYKNLFDFSKKVNLRCVNKKTFESFAMAGAFDCFPEFHRRQFLYAPDGDTNLIEKSIKYGNNTQNEANAAQQSLFGGSSGVDIPLPKVSDCEPYGEIEKLRLEKEVVGFYISGHPLDQFMVEIANFCTCTVDNFANFKNQTITIAGIITKLVIRQGKTGRPFGIFTVEDYASSLEMFISGEELRKNQHMLHIGEFVYIKGKVCDKYNQPDVLEFRPLTIELLSEIRKKLSKGLLLKIKVEDLDINLIESIERLSTENPGDCSLKLMVEDHEENIFVELLSRKFKINPHNELIKKLDALKKVDYKVLS
ncbi:MAG: DNA polymerase III subunit alpha [Bacteroidota bacterium]|nr:DNA polymerase III subunit alpha [Bacteroidota bacterium]